MSKQLDQRRAVAADLAVETNEFKPGYVYSFYTATRAFRGLLVAVCVDHFIVHKPTIVWTADNENVNHKASKYFASGEVKGVLEEPGGEWAFVPIGGCVYTVCHNVVGEIPECKCIDASNGWMKPGTVVHICTVTHEFRGILDNIGSFTLKVTKAAMVNNIENHQFAAVLSGNSEGSDHFKVCDVQVFLHGITGILTAEK
jgi:hypothetical protein